MKIHHLSYNSRSYTSLVNINTAPSSQQFESTKSPLIKNRTTRMKPITSFFFFSTLCLLQHVALGQQGQQGQPPGGEHAGGNTLEEACHQAANKDSCVNTLKADPNSNGADLTGLALIALRLAAANAADVESHLRTLIIKNASGLEPEVQQGVADCIESYSDANEQLDDSIAALSEKNYQEIMTWVKVAIADSNYCESALGGQPQVIADKNKVFLEMCDNVLSIIKTLALQQVG